MPFGFVGILVELVCRVKNPNFNNKTIPLNSFFQTNAIYRIKKNYQDFQMMQSKSQLECNTMQEKNEMYALQQANEKRKKSKTSLSTRQKTIG